MEVTPSSGTLVVIIVIFSVLAVISPVVGLLTDVKLGRYRSVLCSSYVILVEVVLVIFMVIILAAMLTSKKFIYIELETRHINF